LKNRGKNKEKRNKRKEIRGVQRERNFNPYSHYKLEQKTAYCIIDLYARPIDTNRLYFRFLI